MCLAAKKWKIYDDEKSTADEERGEPRRYHIATCKEVAGGGGGTPMAIIYYNYKWLGKLAFRTFPRPPSNL